MISSLAGIMGALLKGKKMGKKTKAILIDAVIGGVLGFAMIDFIDYFLDDGLSQKIVIFISLICGTLAGEIMEGSEKIFNFAISFVGSWFKTKSKEDGVNDKEI